MKKVNWIMQTATRTGRVLESVRNVRIRFTRLKSIDVVEKLYATTADANSANTAEG